VGAREGVYEVVSLMLYKEKHTYPFARCTVGVYMWEQYHEKGGACILSIREMI
jgi:hypothetical protein